MRFRYLAALAAVALLVALPLAAQENRGAIEGVVKDAQGGAVVGATVVAKSLSGISREAVTDATGTYRFPALSPGRYDVTANLSGFSPAKVQNIDLRLGELKVINMSLTPGGLAETVQVVAESPLIAITQSARSTSLREEQIEKMPKGRDFTSLVTQAAGANQESAKLNGISIDGASSGENRFIIDGAESTNLQSGLSAQVLVTDFVDEVQVKSSGYTAEYGGATGGVISAITKSGTNSFHGAANLYYQSDSLDSDFRPTLRLVPTNSQAAEYVTYDEDEYNRWEPGFQLSGPIVKDKMWFFAGYQPVFRPLSRTAALNDGVVRTFDQDFTTNYGTANITAQPSSQWRIRANYNLSNRKTENRLQNLDGTSNPAANYAINDVTPNWATSASIDYTPSNKVYVSLRGGYYFRDFYNEGVYDGTRYLFCASNVGQAGVPAQYQGPVGLSNVPTNNSSAFDKQKRTNLQFDTTFFFAGGGQHQLKVGLQYDKIGNEVLAGETGNLLRLQWNRALSGQRGPYGYYQVRSNGVLPDRGFSTQGDISVTNLGLFIQDSWTIGSRLTLNLGLRTENETVPSYSADPNIPFEAIEFGFDEKLAPRAGFAWDATGDGKTKVYASWGIFYDIFKLELPRGSFGGDKWLEYYYTLDTPAWDTLDVSGCPPACPGTLLRGPIDFRHPSNDPEASAIDPDLKPMKMQEFVVGVDRELSSVLSASVRYVHKQIDRAIEDVGALDAQGNEIYTIANPGFGQASEFGVADSTQVLPFPQAVRDYDAVELSLNKRMQNNWSGRVSYLWSRLYGNYSGLAQSDENGRNSPNVGRLFDYPLMSFDQQGNSVLGLLPTDRPHQFKAQLIYDFKFGLTTGANWYAASGIPKSREAAFIAPNNFPVQYLGRNSDGRTPFYNQLDLYLQQEIKFGDKYRLVLSANVFNLFDQEIATNYFQTELQAGQGIDATEEDFYAGRLDADTLIQEQGLQRDPRFLQDSGFQGQREIRLGVAFRF